MGGLLVSYKDRESNESIPTKVGAGSGKQSYYTPRIRGMQ